MTTYFYPVRHLLIMFALLETTEKKGEMVTSGEILQHMKNNEEKYKKLFSKKKYKEGNIGHILSKEIKERHIIKRERNKGTNDYKRFYALTEEGKEYIRPIMKKWGFE